MNTKISVIIPVYNSGERIRRLFYPLTNILPPSYNYEIIFVDDGSNDSSSDIIADIERKYAYVHTLRMEENKGQLEALLAGYKASTGDIIISLDDDAFEEINCIPEFIKKIEDGYDMALGWRNKNGYPLLRREASFLFNLFVSFLIGIRIHDIGSSLKAKNRKAVDKLISLNGLPPFLKYYRHYRIIEIKLSSDYSQYFPTRYNIIELAKTASLVIRKIIFNPKKQVEAS